MRKFGIALGGGHAFGVPVSLFLIVVAILFVQLAKKSNPMYLSSYK